MQTLFLDIRLNILSNNCMFFVEKAIFAKKKYEEEELRRNI